MPSTKISEKQQIRFFNFRKLAKKTKTQFAIEFTVLIAFMFIIFLGFIAMITSNVLKAKDKEREGIAEDIAAMAKNEIDLAISASNGYKRSFELPVKVSGDSYTMHIIQNRELVVKYADKEFVSFLPYAKDDLGNPVTQVCGDLFVLSNEISKENNVTCVNANLDQTQCQTAQAQGLCDQLDQSFLPGTKCCCQLRYGLCT